MRRFGARTVLASSLVFSWMTAALGEAKPVPGWKTSLLPARMEPGRALDLLVRPETGSFFEARRRPRAAFRQTYMDRSEPQLDSISASELSQLYSRLCSTTYPQPTPVPKPTGTPTPGPSPTPTETPTVTPTPGPTRTILEFQVNTSTLGSQYYPGVACRPTGEFVVVWATAGLNDSGGNGIFGRRYDSSGAAIGLDFRVSLPIPAYSGISAARPAIAGNAAGDFVVVWEKVDHFAPTLWDVLGQRFDSSGSPRGGEFRVNTYTTGAQLRASVALKDDGDFLVFWHGWLQDGSLNGVYGQRFASAGTPQGGEFQVNQYTTNYQFWPRVALAPDGGFLVVWSSRDQDGSADTSLLRRYGSDGAPLTGEIQINQYTTGHQSRPNPVPDGEGGFVIVWSSAGQDGSDDGIFARRFDGAGIAQGSEWQVNSYTLGKQGFPAIASDADGNMVILWESFGNDGDGGGIFGRRIDVLGQLADVEFGVSTHSEGDQFEPEVCFDAKGHFVAVWQDGSNSPDDGLDGSEWGVFGRRFEFDFTVPSTNRLTVATAGFLFLCLFLVLRRSRRRRAAR